MRSCTNCTILSSRTWNKAGSAKGGQVVEAHSDRWGGQLYILVRDLGDARHFGRFGPHERHILDCRVRGTEPVKINIKIYSLPSSTFRTKPTNLL